MARMRICARCARHVRDACPFCALAAAAIGASVALASCGGVEQQSTDGGVADAASDGSRGDGGADAASDAPLGFDAVVPDADQPDVTPVPVYGAPPPAPGKPSRIGK